MSDTQKKRFSKKNNSFEIMNKPRRIRHFSWIYYLLILALIVRIFSLQFIEAAELRRKAYIEYSRNSLISPKRGTIYDKNGKTLAASVDVDTVSIDPSAIIVKDNTEATVKLKEKVAKALSEIFELDYTETLNKVNSNRTYYVIASKVESDKVEKLEKWMKEEGVYNGINIDADSKRYYPYNNLASNLIGFCGTDNDGRFGLEYYWNDTLTGISGRMASSVDSSSTIIPTTEGKYNAAVNGSNITLTIDANIQSIAEKYLKQAVEENGCEKGGCLTIMDPSTGDILAMATYPDYNLNSPFEISTDFETFRNKPVSYTYEPGSCFKVIMAATALEEHIVNPDDDGDFYCSGSIQVSSSRISCANRSGHGSESLREALMNSCNPALIELGQMIGTETLYKYLDAFGLFNKTGILTASEEASTFHDINNVGPVELATTSFGQRFRITPLQMITAAAAIANDGVLMKPRIVSKIENPDTGAVTNIEPEEVRQVVSKETAETVKSIMQSVVDDGGGKLGQVKGYTVGGKTGTSEPDPNHPEDGYVASFLAIAPVENTKVVVLLNLFKPTIGSYYGGQTAAPAVANILSDLLPYLGIESNDTNVEENKISVPNVVGKSIEEAKQTLADFGLTYTTDVVEGEIVSSQTPKAGTMLYANGIVSLYSNEHSNVKTTTVPNIKGMGMYQARSTLLSSNLNIQIIGSGSVISQSPGIGTEVELGTVITVKLQDTNGETH